MTEPALDTLTGRLDRLERHNRRLRLVVATTLVGLATLGVMGQAAPPTKILEATQIHAQRFVLEDAKGRTVGGMFVDEDGAASLMLDVGSRSGGPPAFLVGVKDGIMSVNLWSKDGKAQATIDPHKLVLRQNENSRIALLSDVRGGPLLVLYDGQARQRVWLLAQSHGPPALRLLNSDGTLLWNAP